MVRRRAGEHLDRKINSRPERHSSPTSTIQPVVIGQATAKKGYIKVVSGDPARIGNYIARSFADSFGIARTCQEKSEALQVQFVPKGDMLESLDLLVSGIALLTKGHRFITTR